MADEEQEKATPSTSTAVENEDVSLENADIIKEIMDSGSLEPASNAVIQVANGVSTLFDMKGEKEEEEFDNQVSVMLTRLDEYCGLVDMVRSDTTLCLERTLPAITAQHDKMEHLFASIDKLEVFVEHVGGEVGELERRVEQAEQELQLTSGLSVKRVLSVLPGFKSLVQKPSQGVKGPVGKFTPPHIFSSDDFFPAKTS